MIHHYLKVFLRLFTRNRVLTGINLLGLSTGIACFALIRLYVINERAYDRHLPSADRTYRLAMKGEMSGFSFESAVMGGPFGRVIREDVPEVLTSTTFYKLPRPVLLSRGENKFYEENILYADSVFLDFFGYRVILGDPDRMLEAPYSMILTRSGAEKYFGDENPVGKVITWNNQRDYTVSGIIEDPALNSHLNFDILASYGSLLEEESYRNLLTSFHAFVTYNYVKLEASARPHEAEKKIAAVVEKHMGEGMRETGSRFEIFLQPVLEIHLRSALVHELEPNGNRASVIIFSAISLLILIMACANFINLTTARSASRIHEIGIRRISGAGKQTLFIQFLVESLLFAFTSVLLAWILVGLLEPWFTNFSGINPQSVAYAGISLGIFLLLLGMGVGLLSGLYPAYLMSRSKPLWMMKGSPGKRPATHVFRNTLVVLQLGITVFLVFSSIVIYKQLRLISHNDIGINNRDLLIVPMRDPRMFSGYEVLKQEIESLPDVLDVTAASAYLGNFQQRRGFFVEGFDRNDIWMLHHVSVDPDYLDVMEPRLIMGRNFRSGSIADTGAVIINTAMMKQAGWEMPIGKKIIMPDRAGEREYTVVGLVDDFNYASIHQRVESLLIFNNTGGVRYLILRIRNGKSAVENIAEKWSALYPEYPFDYFFQEDYYNKLYRAEQKTGSLFSYFTGLAILIAVLGLFGLVLFSTARRTVEVGIRKVLGGNAGGLVLMFIREYQILILLACLVALPASWYFSLRWLERFALKTEISPWIYFVSVFLVLLISLGTILFRILRSVQANPVDALRYE